MVQKLGYLALALFILIADQISKWAVTERIIRPALDGYSEPMAFLPWLFTLHERLPFVQIPVWPFFNIAMVWNKGVSFGMFTQDTSLGAWILVAVSVVISLWFAVWLFRTKSRTQSIAIAMVIGGAIGNAIDRIRFGAVVDFLDFHLFGYHYPAFNVADSCVVLGVIILLVYALFFEKDFRP